MQVRKPILRCIAVGLFTLVPFIARANPVVLNPSSLIAFGIVALAALVVEAGVVALLLAFSGVSPLSIFAGFLAANFAVFGFLFYPLLGRVPWPALEVLVVLVDAATIKFLAGLGSFQGDDFRGVTFLRAVVISAIGNAVSFFVGVIAAGAPWVEHNIPPE